MTRSGFSARRWATAFPWLLLPLALLTPPARGQVAFIPSVSSFPDGVGLSVAPVVSADRRYVRMGIAPFFSGLQGFDSYSVPAAVGGTGGGGGPLFAGLNGANPGGMGGVPTPGPAFGPNASMMPMASAEASALLSGRSGLNRPPSLAATARARSGPMNRIPTPRRSVRSRTR